jgi:hypothetical protein
MRVRRNSTPNDDHLFVHQVDAQHADVVVSEPIGQVARRNLIPDSAGGAVQHEEQPKRHHNLGVE